MGRNNRRQAVLVAAGHLFNDFYNSLLIPILPILVSELRISLTMAGAVVSTLSVTTSLLQPVFGWLVDRRPRLWILALSLAWITTLMTLTGFAPHYGIFLFMVGMAGLGSAIYHPLGSVMMTRAVGGRKSLAMSIYTSIGNFGEALVPLIATPVAMALGLKGLVSLAAPGLILAWLIFRAYRREKALEAGGDDGFSAREAGKAPVVEVPAAGAQVTEAQAMEAQTVEAQVVGTQAAPPSTASSRRSWLWVAVLDLVLILRSAVHISLIGFLPVYLVQRGYSNVAAGQILFAFMAAAALGIPFAGLLADRYGRKPVMLFSLAGAFGFISLFLAFDGALGVVMLALAGALILASLPLAVVAAQEMFPARAGMASGLMMGFAWGIGGLGATVTGALSDAFGVAAALHIMIWLLLPAAALVAFLPSHVSLPESAPVRATGA
ncbi:MAG: MFS transporter [Firmicutes bacterium]|nr:MFS transporter [Bacillota bacterium]